MAERIRLGRDGTLTVSELLPCICSVIREVLQGRLWASAFDHDGLGPLQAALSARVKAELQLDVVPPVAAAKPTDAHLKSCFPKRTLVAPLSKAIWKAFASAPRAAVPVAVRLGAVRPPPPRRSARIAGAAAKACPRAAGAPPPRT